MKKSFKGLVSGFMAASLLATSFVLPASAAQTDSVTVGALISSDNSTGATIFGNDSRIKLTKGDLRVGAIFYRCKNSTNYTWGGTAWVFSKRAFATAGHCIGCFFDSNVEEVIVVPGLHSEYTDKTKSKYKAFKIKNVETNYEPVEKYPPKCMDWAILETGEDIFKTEQPGVNCFSISDKSLNKDTDTLNMISYNQDFVCASNPWKFEQYGQYKQSIEWVRSDQIASYLDNEGGASGSPVFTNDGCAVGINIAVNKDASFHKRIDQELLTRMYKYREIYDNKSANMYSYTISYNLNGGDRNYWLSGTRRVISKNGEAQSDYCIEDGKINKNYFLNSKGNFYGWTVKNTSGKWLYKNSKGVLTWRSDSQNNSGMTKVVYGDEAELPVNILSEADAKNGENLTLVANWIKYTVKYNSNGGTLNNRTMDNTYVIYNVPTTLSKNVFQKSGGHFLGWYAHRASDNKWFYDSADGKGQGWYLKSNVKKGVLHLYKDGAGIAKSSSVDKDTVTMYAQWGTSTYNVIYNKNDSNAGNETMAKTVVTYGTTSYLRPNAFTNAGKKFVGWYAHRASDDKWFYDSADGKGQGWYLKSQVKNGVLHLYKDKAGIAKSSSIDNDDVTMNAKWTLKGDVDGNGSVNIKDATAVQKYCSNMITLDYERIVAGDMNDDGKLTVSDVTELQKYINTLPR